MHPGRNGSSYNPEGSARAAGLRYVTDALPGISRQRSGTGLRYLAPDGKAIHKRETLVRIRALAVPPAWREVWICARDDGHLQATGRDARGRKQYRYHDRWREVRDETKYARMPAFARALPPEVLHPPRGDRGVPRRQPRPGDVRPQCGSVREAAARQPPPPVAAAGAASIPAPAATKRRAGCRSSECSSMKGVLK